MANYQTKGRTNYFKVKDIEKFKNEIVSSMYDGDVEIMFNDDATKVGILFDDWMGANSWYMPYYDEELDDIDNDKEVSIPQIVSKHLVESEVAIFVEIGSEKLRYLTGYSVAINSKGEQRSIEMDSIYELAKELTDIPDQITEAVY